MIFQILIVDDEPHVVDTIRGILEQEPVVDLEIHTAFRGQQALKLCQQYPISLLITDIRMPDKRLPAMQEAWVQSLGREDPLEKEMATHSSILAWGRKESDRTEQLTL